MQCDATSSTSSFGVGESGATKGFWVPEGDREQLVNCEAVVLRFGSLDAGERTDECGEASCDILGRFVEGRDRWKQSGSRPTRRRRRRRRRSSQSSDKTSVCGLSPSLPPCSWIRLPFLSLSLSFSFLSFPFLLGFHFFLSSHFAACSSFGLVAV